MTIQKNADDKLTIYSIAACPYAQRTRMLLELKSIPFELVEIDITRPRPDWFLQLNPAGKVPVIAHQGRAINESSVINEYLEDVFPTPRSEEHTSELQSRGHLVCRLLL